MMELVSSMPIVNPTTSKYWFNGLPFQGVKTANDNGEIKFWFNGLPGQYIFPAVTPPPGPTVTSGQLFLLMGIGT